MKKLLTQDMSQTQPQQSLSDIIAQNLQHKFIEFTDKSTGEVKSAPRFVLRGFKNLTPGQTIPQKIYFDGNKTYDALRSEGYNLPSIVHALYMKARVMKNYCSELKIYDNAADPANQLIYDYVAGIIERKEKLTDYLTFKKV